LTPQRRSPEGLNAPTAGDARAALANVPAMLLASDRRVRHVAGAGHQGERAIVTLTKASTTSRRRAAFSVSACAEAAARPAAAVLAPRILLIVAMLAVGLCPAAAGHQITDSAGRSVNVPDRIDKVMAAGPPASVLLYVLCPEKLVGWVRKPREAELPYLAKTVRNLPELGRLTGRGDTANLEGVVKAKPDVIIDFGSVTPTYVSLADRVQSQTGIPYLLFDGRFAKTAEVLRLVGATLGVDARAEMLAHDAEDSLAEIDRVTASVPPAQRPRVYLARGPSGLETGTRGSINTEIIERAGGINVVDLGGEQGRLTTVSLEQVLAWNPDTIVSIDAAFVAGVRKAPGWADTAAVRGNRVYVSPSLPFGWIDSPPALNRLIGLKWLARLFFPDRFSKTLRETTRDFYARYYQVDLTDAQLDQLLTPQPAGP
jgi:iron complex transport system substrate-binding protein